MIPGPSATLDAARVNERGHVGAAGRVETATSGREHSNSLLVWHALEHAVDARHSALGVSYLTLRGLRERISLSLENL